MRVTDAGLRPVIEFRMLSDLNYEHLILSGLKLTDRFAGNTPCFRGLVSRDGGRVLCPFGNLMRLFQLITQADDENSLRHNNQKQSGKREDSGHSPSPTCSPQLFDLRLSVIRHARIQSRASRPQSFNGLTFTERGSGT